MSVTVLIFHNAVAQSPPVVEGVRLTWERRGAAGRLELTLPPAVSLDCAEGDSIRLDADGTPMFFGFVFTLRRSGAGELTVTAYDQLRYLKSKDTVTEEGIKASDLLKRLAADFHLSLGETEDTGYRLETVVEENQTLLDMLQNALDETLRQTGRLYVLYDDCGRLTLKSISSMRLDLLIDEETAEELTYQSSIDGETYNKIKLSYANEDTGKRELYVAQDGEKQNRWGVLQYFEELQTAVGAGARAEALLRLYGSPARSLTVKGALGDPRVRGGSGVAVSLSVGDERVERYMVVNRVTHSFGSEGHRMELELMGGDFFG